MIVNLASNPVILSDDDSDNNAWIPTDDEHSRIFKLWPEWTLSERARPTSSWIWTYGFEIQHNTSRRWVCMVCLRSRRGRPVHLESKGTQNAENHLWKDHGRWDPSQRRSPPSEKKGKRAYPSVMDTMGLIRSSPRDQAVANKLIKSFDRDHFHTLCVNWVVDAQLSFRAIENPRLRLIFEYLNPSVEVQDAHLSRRTIRGYKLS
jgi:hypothetical protein